MTHPAGPVPTDRTDLAEAVRMLLRTVLPVGVLLGLALAVYGGTGHDLTIVLQDRFPEESEYSGLFTIAFSSALMVCAGIALGSLVVSRAWSRATGEASATSPALTAALAVAVLCIFLGFDDMMMVHDAVLPGAGIPEDVALGAYALLGLVLVAWAFRPLLAERLGLTFLAGLALLGGSLGGDVLESLLEEDHRRIATVLGHAEDVVKFLAYAALCHLCVLLARIMARTFAAATEKAAREAVERAGVPTTGASGTTPGPGRVPLRVTAGRHAAPTGSTPTMAGLPDDDLTRPIPRP